MSKGQIFWACLIALAIHSTTLAQESSNTEAYSPIATEDEVIAHGEKYYGQHEGMKAFFDGDFETAEIEFEQLYNSLKRGKSATENAAIDAANQLFRASQLASVGGTSRGSGGLGGPADSGFGASTTVGAGVSSSFSNKKKRGESLLTDEVVTYHDFAFARYMSGLSEIQLGKIDEAKKSFKTSLSHNSKNYDARMRLGLIYLQESDYKKASKQLEKLDNLRKKCKVKSCPDIDYINESTVTLAKAITDSIQ